MKTIYQTPATEVAKLQTSARVLTGSIAADPAGAPGIGAGRSDYGNGGDLNW